MMYKMMGWLVLILPLFFTGVTSCKNETSPPAPLDSMAVLEKQRATEIKANIEKLKQTAQDGDLVVRLSDDFVSEQLRMFNEKDKAFSHSGIVITKDGIKTICSILPGLPNTNPVVYSPIDSFVDPATTIFCGLFRYDLSATEKQAFIDNINSVAHRPVYFDSVLNINTDDSLYCSEMIYKAMRKATKDRLKFKLGLMPKKMQNTVYRFYRGRFTKETVANRQIMFIDNLYLIPQCKELMRFRTKYFPGQ